MFGKIGKLETEKIIGGGKKLISVSSEQVTGLLLTLSYSPFYSQKRLSGNLCLEVKHCVKCVLKSLITLLGE